jgi:hypothetical protein
MQEYVKAKQRSALTQPSVEQLEEAFIRHTKRLQRIFLCLDAVNECQDAAAIASVLLRLAARCGNLRILVTTTWNPVKQDPEVGLKMFVIPMDSSNVNKDISVFVDNMLAIDWAFKNTSAELKLKIRSTVLNNTEGM